MSTDSYQVLAMLRDYQILNTETRNSNSTCLKYYVMRPAIPFLTY